MRSAGAEFDATHPGWPGQGGVDLVAADALYQSLEIGLVYNANEVGPLLGQSSEGTIAQQDGSSIRALGSEPSLCQEISGSRQRSFGSNPAETFLLVNQLTGQFAAPSGGGNCFSESAAVAVCMFQGV